MEERLVIRGATIPGLGAGAALVIEGRRIAAVLPPGRPVEARPGDWDVEADGRLVVPGLVDAHTDLAIGPLLWAAGLPGRPPSAAVDLVPGLRRRLEERLSPDALEPLARAGALAALRAGVTTAFELGRGVPGAAGDALEARARAVGSVGIRARLAWAARGVRAVEEIAATSRFAAARVADPRVRGCPGLSSLAETSDEALEAVRPAASAAGLHASVGEDESDLAHAFARFGGRPVEVLARHGLLGPRAVVAMAGPAIHAEALRLAEHGSALAVTPRSAAFRGAPLPALAPLARLGLRIVLGTDGLFPDVAGEAVALAMLHRHLDRNAGAAAGLVGGVTRAGAAALASETFGAPLGTLAPGALADVVILDWRPPLPLPAAPDGDLAPLWAGAPAAWAIVDGVVRLREGRLLGGDEAEIAARAREAAARLLAA